MPRNDWRTDNWGGYQDVGRDPNNYHFARDLKRHGHNPNGYYRSNNDYDNDTQISIFTLILIVLALLFLSGVVDYVRQILQHGGSLIEMWWMGWDDMSHTFSKYYAK